MWKYFLIFLFPALNVSLAFAAATGQVDLTNSVPDLAASQGGAGSGTVVNWVQSFYQFSLIGGVFLAVGVITWAGLKYALAAGNPSGQSDARDQILQALLGLVLLFGAFLVLYTINPNLTTNLSMPTLKSVSVALPTVTTQQNAGFNGGATANSIEAAAAAYQGASTANGPGDGVVACAWAVNNVLASAGIAPIDSSSVQSMENALASGRGTLVNQSAAAAGDIVIQAQDGHVGICLNTGCTQVLSNSSSRARFSWISGTDFAPTYSGGPGRIYRVNN